VLCLTNRANAGGIGIAFRNGLVLGIAKGPGTAGLENDEQFILHTVFVFFCFAFFLKCCCCLGIYLIMPSVLFFNQNAAPHIKF